MCSIVVLSIQYRVLDRIGPRGLSAHLRTFVDYLVAEFAASSTGSQHLNQCVESLSELIWNCNVITIDRVILALVRTSGKKELC